MLSGFEGKRGATAGIPLDAGLVLHLNTHVEPRARPPQTMPRSRARCMGPFWLTLLVVAFFMSLAEAARGNPIYDTHPHFRVAPPQPMQQGVEPTPVFQFPEAALQTESEHESDEEDSDSSGASSFGSDRDVLFKVYGFGYVLCQTWA